MDYPPFIIEDVVIDLHKVPLSNNRNVYSIFQMRYFGEG